MAIRPARAAIEEDDRGEEGEGVTAARPNLVASFPPERRSSSSSTTDVPLAVDVAKLHFFDAETGAPLR